MTRTRIYSQKEELANSISHAFGIVLGIVAGYFLLRKAYDSHSCWAIASVYVYLFGMLFSYITSTWYHSLPVGKQKLLLQKFDHAAIYFHIAGTYTPLTLVTLREEGFWGWGILSFVWLAALMGTIVSFRRSAKHSYIETVCYVAMGCVVLVAFKPMVDVLTATGRMEVLWWIIAGGISYILGAVFYSLAKLRYMHTVFHFFVLGGSVCHIVAIYLAI